MLVKQKFTSVKMSCGDFQKVFVADGECGFNELRVIPEFNRFINQYKGKEIKVELQFFELENGFTDNPSCVVDKNSLKEFTVRVSDKETNEDIGEGINPSLNL